MPCLSLLDTVTTRMCHPVQLWIVFLEERDRRGKQGRERGKERGEEDEEGEGREKGGREEADGGEGA